METKELAPSLIESFTDFDIAQITPDLAEVALDNVLDDGLVKDIPVVRSLYAFYKTTVSLRDRALIKKLLIFLSSLSSVSPEKRKAFKDRINKDEKFKQKVGEQLLLILERLDDMEKPYLVAHAFQAYIEELINYEIFQRLASVIDRSFFLDLKSLKSVKNYRKLSSHSIINLVNSGILELVSTTSVILTAENNKYQLSDLGKILLKFVLKT